MVVPESADILLRSADLLRRGGTGTSVDTTTGKITDLEDEYLFGGGFAANRIVAYVSFKYKKIKR